MLTRRNKRTKRMRDRMLIQKRRLLLCRLGVPMMISCKPSGVESVLCECHFLLWSTKRGSEVEGEGEGEGEERLF